MARFASSFGVPQPIGFTEDVFSRLYFPFCISSSASQASPVECVVIWFSLAECLKSHTRRYKQLTGDV